VKELDDSKEVIKGDLDLLSSLLLKHEICTDTSPLQKAIGHIYSNSSETAWECKISDLIFPLNPHQHMVPHDAEFLELYLSMDLKGIYASDSLVNPLTLMEFNIVVAGYNKQAEDLLAAWHFDKHEFGEDDNETTYIHPEYHFTYGGRKMWNRTDLSWGASLILPTPRFVHPPLDAILGIDFVLGNYIEKDKCHKITKLPEYKKMIYRSQLRMWRPYYLSISNHWQKHSSREEAMDLGLLVPNLTDRIN
jgi:hypothetical protein